MYGTIAELHVLPNKEEALLDELQTFVVAHVPGFIAHYVYRVESTPDRYFLVVLFETREAYLANANSPAQHKRFQRMITLLNAEPTWHDGEIIYSQQFVSAVETRE